MPKLPLRCGKNTLAPELKIDIYIFSETKILAQGSNEICTETRGFGKLTLCGSALIKPEVTFADMRQFPR